MQLPDKYYQEQKEIYQQRLATITKQVNLLSTLRLWLGVAVLSVGIWAFRAGGQLQWALVAALVAGFLVLVRRHTSMTAKRDLVLIHINIIDHELRALTGDYSSFDDGAVYAAPGHPYSLDLDLYGKRSIYQMLCRCISTTGAQLLAARLGANQISAADSQQYQEIVQDLSKHPGFLQDFRVTGIAQAEGKGAYQHILEWLAGKDLFISQPLVRIASVVLPASSLVFIAWSGFIGAFHVGLTITIIINWVVLAIYRKQTTATTRQLGLAQSLVGKYGGLLQQAATYSSQQPWLAATAARAAGATTAVNRLKQLLNLIESRSNGMVGPIMNSFFLMDIRSLMQLERWRKQHHAQLHQAMDDMAAMDALVSCAVYAFNHPEYTYPVFTTAGTPMIAQGLRHPLLHAASAVGNDFSIGQQERFYLLTGANMTGKSTFMRTIGVNLLLMRLGLPLPAVRFSAPPLLLFTSMRITDSVQDDISYFRAELNRIKELIDTVRQTPEPYLILLDEPLRGTNSTDKQQGTRSILETLLRCHAMGIVATHDTGLCDMATQYPGQITNYHFESNISPTGLTFDFKLKPGGSTSNNATLLMRQMGIVE